MKMADMGTKSAALVVVDMQNAFCNADGSFTAMGADMQMCADAIPGCRQLIDSAHTAGVPVIYLQTEWRSDFTDGGVIFNEIMGGMAENQALVTGTWDAQIVDELKPEDRDYIIYKKRFSDFYGTQLEPLLTSLRTDSLIVCGVTTNICVESTVRDGAQRDYRCFVPKNAVGEVSQEMHDAGLRAMEYGFAKIVTVDDVVQDWSTGASRAIEATNDSPSFLRPKDTPARG